MKQTQLCKKIGEQIEDFLTNISNYFKNGKPSHTWKDKYELSLLIHLIKKSKFQPSTKSELLLIIKPIKQKFLKDIKCPKVVKSAKPFVNTIDDLLDYLDLSKAK